MELVSFSSPGFWWALFRAELTLTVSIAVGLLMGELILSAGIVERAFKPIVPLLSRWGIHHKIAFAMIMALGSPRSASALIAASYSDGEISEDETTFGTLAMAFPGYLRRWVGTATIAVAAAGRAGFIYAIIIITRSALRFTWVIIMLRRRSRGIKRDLPTGDAAESRVTDHKARRARLMRTLKRSLPLAWIFFGLTYALMPWIEELLRGHISDMGIYHVMPPQGWAVAFASLAHMTAALSSAGGALEGGALSVGQAVLALVIGNMIGAVTRAVRQNVGYWMGIFPAALVPRLVRWHLATQLSLELLTVLLLLVII